MKLTIHRIASLLATFCIALFFTSTLLVELFGSHSQIITIKSLIVTPGIFILVPAMALTGATGFALAKHRKGKIVERKKKRMPIIAAIGILILIPAAIFLRDWAVAGEFDTKFYILQAIELIAGATNLSLMIASIKDGKRLVKK